MLRTTLFLLLAVLNVGVSQAAQTVSIWAVDCSNTKTNYWFLMDEADNVKYPILIGNSIKVTPYPGLHDVKDIHNDPRIIWVSNDQISVSNDNKRKLGWSGRLIFNRCKVPR